MVKKNLSILPFICLPTVSTKSVDHKLHAIAYSKDRNSHLKY